MAETPNDRAAPLARDFFTLLLPCNPPTTGPAEPLIEVWNRWAARVSAAAISESIDLNPELLKAAGDHQRKLLREMQTKKMWSEDWTE